MSEMATHPVIVLVGMPGAGKSTVGALLAQRLGCDWIDTDRLIEADGGAPLAELLERHGMDGFRDLESAALRRALLKAERAGAAIISTGGSAVYCTEAMVLLRQRAWIVYLDLDLPTLEARAGDLYRRGVVRQPGQSLQALFDERVGLYLRYAHRRYECGSLSAAALCELIATEAG